jgi:hypothetical protein
MLMDDGFGISLCLVEGGHIGIINPKIAFRLIIVSVNTSHDSVIEIPVTLTQSVDGEMFVVKEPCKQTGMLLVFEVNVAIKDSDGAIRLQFVNLERVLMIDMLEINVDRVAIEHVGDNILVFNYLVKMINEVQSVTLFEGTYLTNHVVREFNEHTSIFWVRFANTL